MLVGVPDLSLDWWPENFPHPMAKPTARRSDANRKFHESLGTAVVDACFTREAKSQGSRLFSRRHLSYAGDKASVASPLASFHPRILRRRRISYAPVRGCR